MTGYAFYGSPVFGAFERQQTTIGFGINRIEDSTNIVADTITTFNAKNSNTLYGSSSTVQPPAISSIFQIKF